MKMHSYAFYNGHLSETRRRLKELDTPATASKAAAYRYPKPSTHLSEIPQSPSDEEESDATTKEELRQLRVDLAFELASPLGGISYPQNLTWYNFADFIFCPTLCYELEYPRTPRIRWMELFYKTLAVFGCIFLLTFTTEEFVLPVLQESRVALQDSTSALDFLLVLGETIGRLLFPFMVTFLLVFLVIFEYLLGAFAELTRKCHNPTNIAQNSIYLLLSRIRRSPILRRLVEQLRLARVLSRMEQTRSPLLQAPCLLRVSGTHVSTTRNRHHIPHQCSRTRARHGLYHEKVPRLRIPCNDAPDAHCDGSAITIRQRSHPSQQRHVLVLHDPRSGHGTY